MTNSSPETSPNSAAAGGRLFSMSSDQFSMDIPSPRLKVLTDGQGNEILNVNENSSLKSPTVRRLANNFSRQGVLGSAHKERNLSQSSGDREFMTNGDQSQNGHASDEGINPLKRRNTDAGIDYPRRRATIAVGRSSHENNSDAD